MALTEGSTALPYGLREVKLTPLLGTNPPSVKLPNSRTFSFTEAEDYEELRGDDKIVATRGKGANVEWELESGGISLAALKVMNGGTVTVSGVAPATVVKYTKKVTDGRPEFRCEGRAISESGGDFHVVLYRCKANSNIEGSLEDGTFWLTSASGVALAVNDGGADQDVLYDFVLNETATPVV